VQIAWLLRQRPDYLLTQPTNLAMLLRHCREHAVKLGLRGVSTFGEVVDPDLRDVCRETFGLEIADMYSAREAGYVALQCPAFPHYHVQAEDMLVEILDDGGNDCAPGQIGRVVITPLHEYATPLIRYAIGDEAEPGPPYACGRGLPVIRRIYGRARNVLLLPSGRKVYPSLNGARLGAIAPVIQAQFVQRSLDRLDVRLVARRALTAGEEDALRALIRDATTWDFALAISYCAEIPRGPGGKYEDFRSELVS
jgi:phenylacetate-CoA ligase